MSAASVDTDVLVVGGGPGGAAAAYHLARHGVDVTVVDKARFPRDKVCGDGIPPRGVKALARMGIDWRDHGFAPAHGLRTYGTEGVVIDLPWPKLRAFPDVGLVMARYDFDHLLAKRAVEAGARLYEATEATAPLLDGGWVRGAVVREEDGATREIRAGYVVAADGHASRLSQQAGVKRDPTRAIGVAARRYYRTTRPFEPVLESFLNLQGGDGLMPGYGWIFFAGDDVVNVGAGLLSTFRGFRGTSARKVFDAFVSGLPPEWGITEENALGPVASGPLPTAMNRRPLAVPGMLLVGDAAGMVNPFNGEGISCAMESGELAAELITDALARNRPAIAQMYPSLLRARYGRYYFMGNKWARMIGNPWFMRFAVKHGIPRRRLMVFALRMLANLSDGWEGDVDDKVMTALLSMAPPR